MAYGTLGSLRGIEIKFHGHLVDALEFRLILVPLKRQIHRSSSAAMLSDRIAQPMTTLSDLFSRRVVLSPAAGIR